MYGMFENKEVAARQLPVAHGRDDRDARLDRPRSRFPEARRPSEPRLQASVVPPRNPDDGDLYADVPCTD